MKYSFLVLFLLNILTLFASPARQSSIHSFLPIPIVKTNVQADHRLPSKLNPEQLIVIATRKTDIESGKTHETISQAATSFIFTFDLDESIDLVTLPGLPLKLYPTKEAKMSTFATFIPETAEGYYSSEVDYSDDDDEEHMEPLLWEGHDEELCGSAVAIIETHPETQTRSVTIQTWINLQKLPEIRLELAASEENTKPSKSRYAKILGKLSGTTDSQTNNRHKSMSSTATTTTTAAADSSIKNAILHYYRGHRPGCAGYTALEEAYDYLHTMFVGFLSPFVLLGMLFVCIAAGVFVWLHVVYGSDGAEDDPNDPIIDEKHRILLV